MVILAGSGWGMLQAAKIEECYRQMRYLRKLIFRIRSEIRYSRRVLPEAFLSVGSEAQEPYKMWLLSLYERLENRQGTSLAGIWEEETRTHLPVIGIPQDMLESLIRLGGELGTIDIEMQVRTLDLYLERNGAENGGHENGTEGENPSVSMYRSDRRGISGNHPPVRKGRVCMTINLIFKIAAVGILVSILCQVLKHSGREEQAFLTSLAGLLLVLFWIVPYIYDLFESIQNLFSL